MKRKTVASMSPGDCRIFMAALEDNEDKMSDMAALSVTLEQFGFEPDEHDVLGEILDKGFPDGELRL